jgi:hypothetical protein
MIDYIMQTKTAAVLPFCKGSLVWKDGMLSTIYYSLKELDRLETTFCGDSPDHDEFIRDFDPSRKVAQILCEVGEESKLHPVGIAWVELPKGVKGERAALCGFAFFKRSREMYNLGRMGIYYWMAGLDINVVHGVMLHSNLQAIKYAIKMGFSVSFPIPRFHFYQGKLVSAVAVTLEDHDFLPTFEPWFDKNRVATP